MAIAQQPMQPAEVRPAPRTLVVGSHWPSWDKHAAARIQIAQISARDGFPTDDSLSELDTRSTRRGDDFCVGCAYPERFEDDPFPCTFRLAIAPGKCPLTGLPCGFVSHVSLKHNHDFSSSSSRAKRTQREERDFLEVEQKEYGPNALLCLKKNKKKWEHRVASVDTPTEAERERAFTEQREILDDLRAVLGEVEGQKWAKEARRTRVVLTEEQRTEPLTDLTRTRKKSTSTPASPALSRVSQAPSPEPPRIPKRAPSSEASGEDAERAKKQKKAAAKSAAESGRSGSGGASSTVRKGTPQMIELEDSDDEEEDVKPVVPIHFIDNAAPPPPAPVALAAAAKPPPPAAVADSSPLAAFLSSLNSPFQFSRYTHLFSRPTIMISTAEELLFTAQEAKDLDDLLVEFSLSRPSE